MAQRRRVGAGKEMAALDEHVHGEHEIAAGGGRDHRAIIADAHAHRLVAHVAAKVAVDEREFVHAKRA